MKKNTDNTKDEYHVASFVAYPVVTQLDEVKEEIISTEGTEIHAVSDEGKIVFTIEGKSYRDIGAKMDSIKAHKGMINLSPVYHQVLDESKNDDSSLN